MKTKQTLLILLLLATASLPAQTQNTIDNFILLPGGNYPLGEDNVPITLSPFYLSPTEVSYGQMMTYVLDNQALARAGGRTNWRPEYYSYDAWGVDLRRAAVNVNWFEAIRYANWCSDTQGLDRAYRILDAANQPLSPEDSLYWRNDAWERVEWDRRAKGYRLPTEAEGEYAASGYAALGYKQVYAGCNAPDKLADYAWYDTNAGSKAQAVATRKPNAHGLYDMSGNVWEWCWDFYEEAAFAGWAEQKDPAYKNDAKPYDSRAALRGGSWSSNEN